MQINTLEERYNQVVRTYQENVINRNICCELSYSHRLLKLGTDADEHSKSSFKHGAFLPLAF